MPTARANGSESLPSESLVVVSDLHLGSDLLDHAPKGAQGARSSEFDLDFVRLLDHYRAEVPPADRWRLVVAGDLFDFIGMSLGPDRALGTKPTEEELAHGLGNAADHAVAKMRAVAERHGEVFRAVSRFVAAGHGLTIIHGNHDLELHWAPVKQELLDTLLRLAHAQHAAPATGPDAAAPIDEAAFLARIETSEWFFFRDGVAYIEHGHQYDPFCATENVLAPLSPLDPTRLARGFCDVLLRYVVRQTPGMPDHGHEETGLYYYFSFALNLGVGGAFRLGLNYVRAIRELFRLRRTHLSEAAGRMRAKHDRLMRRFALAQRIQLRKVRKLAALRALPITTTVGGILASLLVDKILLFLSCAMGLAVVAVVAGVWEPWVALASPIVPASWVLGSWLLAKQRKVDPVVELAKRAGALATLFPAPFIVMGHSHVPVRADVNEGQATYFNVGSWTDEQSERTARTHLVIHPRAANHESKGPHDSGAHARFLRWDRELGPTEIVPSRPS